MEIQIDDYDSYVASLAAVRPKLIDSDKLFNERDVYSPKHSDRVRFLVISDSGEASDELTMTADAMAQYTQQYPIDFVCGLGDNFYPHGVEDITDSKFETHWAEVFLYGDTRKGLCVPWYMALGNHDYMADNPHTQVIFTHSDINKNKYNSMWRMPAPSYKFAYNLTILPESNVATSAAVPSSSGKQPLIECFVLDTCACQDHVLEYWPEQVEQLKHNIAALKRQLLASNARWKFVFGHHMLHTQGFGHADTALVLRDSHEHNIKLPPSAFTRRYNEKFREYGILGYGLEQVLIEGGCNAYFGGHEHVFQYTFRHGIHHFCCGASGADIRPASGFYRGMATHVQPMDWYGQGNDYGFVSVEANMEECVVNFHQARSILRNVRNGINDHSNSIICSVSIN